MTDARFAILLAAHLLYLVSSIVMWLRLARRIDRAGL